MGKHEKQEVMEFSAEIDELAYYKERNQTLLRENNELRKKLDYIEETYVVGDELHKAAHAELQQKIDELKEENAKLKEALIREACR